MSDEAESPMRATRPTGSGPPASVGELSDSPAGARGEQPAAEPATAVERSGVEALETVRADLSALSGDLAALVASLGGLSDRIGELERSVAQASQELGPLAEAARGPEAESLRELGGMLTAVQAAGAPEQLQPTLDILDQLAEQPRDIELLLKLSQQAPTLRELSRLHLHLAAAAPTIRAALDRLVR